MGEQIPSFCRISLDERIPNEQFQNTLPRERSFQLNVRRSWTKHPNNSGKGWTVIRKQSRAIFNYGNMVFPSRDIKGAVISFHRMFAKSE